MGIQPPGLTYGYKLTEPVNLYQPPGLTIWI
jgi:hypothetical protein